MTKEEDLANYLSKKEFTRFIEAWYKKYYHLGHLGGKIVLEQLNDNELQSLCTFLGMNIVDRKLQLTYTQLTRCLNKTRFENVDFLETLNILYGATIKSKKELEESHENKLKDFQTDLLENNKNTPSYVWLNHYFKTNKLVKRYLSDRGYREMINLVCKALNELPIYEDNYESLPVFSQKITKNPHYFDKGIASDLLIDGVSYLLNIRNNQYNHNLEILYDAGIVKDELSNYCYICHIAPKDKNSRWLNFYNNYEPWNMNLYNLKNIQDLMLKSNIYIFENPAVFINVCEFIKKEKIDVGVVCSNGQINFCTYKLLDLLVESKCHLYYSGDYDSEGLLIADKLKKRYKDKLTLWKYDVDLFDKVIIKQSDINAKRMTMLDNIENDKLKIIASCIKLKNSFGYQEGLIEDYKQEIYNKYVRK